MKEILIYANPMNSNHEKGQFFEELVAKILRNQRYKVKERINFTGMEIDLICEHIDRNEKAFVECKAREDLSANDISKFVFNVTHKKIDYGIFLYTKYFQHQAGGIVEEIKEDERYKNIYFWDCDKIISLLVEDKEISAFNQEYESYRVAKSILLYSYFGVFYVVLLSNSTISEFFCVYDAKNLDVISDTTVLENVQKVVKEVRTLTLFVDNSKFVKVNDPNAQEDTRLEVVAEIQESESWDDFKPASIRYFVGRKNLKEQIFNFFDKVQKNETSNRVFYIDGKSGWGKSSLVNELRGRCRNKYYKNRYFLYPVDSRSATSSNFVALSFKRMIEEAEKKEFIKLDARLLEITSNYDVLASNSVKDIIKILEKQQKVMILVFDQFEDVFRKGDLFKAFYKFLLDTRNYNSNLIIGFSWKSEINIPISHEAYYLWQQSNDYSFRLSMPEFDFAESKEIIKQLEKAISQKLDNDFIRKIADNSQGFPWLVKKLCVHIYKQIISNSSISTLYEQDFNVESLFKEDLEGLSPEENRALNYIAKRAFDDNSFDATETDEIISTSIIDSLVLHRKLVIKSGSKYNIYWDIFRDYLVTKEVPKIGETYLIRQTVTPVMDMYLLFKDSNSLTLDEISSLMLNPTKKGTILNSLRLLRDIGLINVKNDKYVLKRKELGVNEEDFKQYIHDKLLKHTLLLEIQKIEGEKIDLIDIIELIKLKFKSRSYAEETLKLYAQDFINWLKYAEIDIPQISTRLRLEAQNLTTFTPQNMPMEDIQFFMELNDEQTVILTKKISKILYDLKTIGLITYSKNRIYLSQIGKKIIASKDKNLYQKICAEALKTDKVNRAYQVYSLNPNINVKMFKSEIQDLLFGINSLIYQNKTNRVLYMWAKFIYDFGKNNNLLENRKPSKK